MVPAGRFGDETRSHVLLSTGAGSQEELGENLPFRCLFVSIKKAVGFLEKSVPCLHVLVLTGTSSVICRARDKRRA